MKNGELYINKELGLVKKYQKSIRDMEKRLVNPLCPKNR